MKERFAATLDRLAETEDDVTCLNDSTSEEEAFVALVKFRGRAERITMLMVRNNKNLSIEKNTV